MSARTLGAVSQGLLAAHERFNAWATVWGAAPTLKESHNVTSVTKDATGDYTVTFGAAFAASAYAVVIGCTRIDTAAVSGIGGNIRTTSLPAVGSVALRFTQLGTVSTLLDPTYFTVACVGNV